MLVHLLGWQWSCHIRIVQDAVYPTATFNTHGIWGMACVGPGTADPESRTEQLRLGIETLHFIVMRQWVRVRRD